MFCAFSRKNFKFSRSFGAHACIFVNFPLAEAILPEVLYIFAWNANESSETSRDLFCAPWVGVSIYAIPRFQLVETVENEPDNSRSKISTPSKMMIFAKTQRKTFMFFCFFPKKPHLVPMRAFL